MTKEEAIKYLQQLYPNGGHCWLDEQRIEAIGVAVEALQENGNSLTKDEFLSEFLAKTLSRKLGINRMPECEKEECNKTYIPNPYSPDRSKYPYFEAYKEGFLSAMSIAEDILVKMFNEYDNLTKD